jgi:UDP-N-acetylglucosamine enolpyruvyl transferase
MGARIKGHGTPTIEIEGVQALHGAEHTIIPDRIEAATLMIAALITRGDVEIKNVLAGHLGAVIDKLEESTFHAKIVLKVASGEEIILDARPSDSIALAVRAQAPIFVEDDIIKQSEIFNKEK